ncbi:hypothetical protein ACRAWB_17950 [Leifsonia poae]|uniref:hypothetical protein n=1 Tax=Leifsonia poae TaxID=110933 RepID=UPI003D684FF2
MSTARTLPGPSSTGTPSPLATDEYVTRAMRSEGAAPMLADDGAAGAVVGPPRTWSPMPWNVTPSPTRGGTSRRVTETGMGAVFMKPEYCAE